MVQARAVPSGGLGRRPTRHAEAFRQVCQGLRCEGATLVAPVCVTTESGNKGMMAARIAVVNDDTEFLELMRELLESEGYAIRTHKVAVSAYAEIKADCPDLIILDIRMETPEAGWQLLELLQLDPNTVATPVIICSADTPFLRAKEAHLRERGYRTLEKPFNLEELLAIVAESLAATATC